MMSPDFVKQFISEHSDGKPFGMTKDFQAQVVNDLALAGYEFAEAEEAPNLFVLRKKEEPEIKE